jgi:hypothetical protein
VAAQDHLQRSQGPRFESEGRDRYSIESVPAHTLLALEACSSAASHTFDWEFPGALLLTSHEVRVPALGLTTLDEVRAEAAHEFSIFPLSTGTTAGGKMKTSGRVANVCHSR